MARIYAMCDFCKLDKTCDYESVIQKHDNVKYGFMNSLYVCPNFIYDDGNLITNAEMLSTNIKTNIEQTALELWEMLVEYRNVGTIKTYEEFLEWLKDKADINT